MTLPKSSALLGTKVASSSLKAATIIGKKAPIIINSVAPEAMATGTIAIGGAALCYG